MKFRRTFRFHGLRRPRIRQTWNKYNLFNLQANLRLPRIVWKTFFQQKWFAKALTRGYHGEHIKERQWERMFSRRLDSVVDMNPRYMAAFDGAEQAAGRGSGRRPDPDVPLSDRERLRPEAGTNQAVAALTPYMNMAFAPMERRLDIAVFRAMFASSARQARQFVVHGAVTVNGKKMIYPGYLLNPGDLFQVDVQRVLFATGAKKPTRSSLERSGGGGGAPADEDAGAEAAEAADAEDAEAAEAGAEAKDQQGETSLTDHERALRELPALAERAKELLADHADDLTAKRKKKLRQFVKDARKWVAKASKTPLPPPSDEADPAAAAEAAAAAAAAAAPPAAGARARARAPPPPPSPTVVDQLADLLADLPPLTPAGKDKSKGKDKDSEGSGNASAATLTPEERERFRELLAREAENPKDPSKPYATPWRPRPFMEPFAFIPRYLEVNQNICAAVYLRHPVARPGIAEVPSPFPQELHQLAFNWYLRRH